MQACCQDLTLIPAQDGWICMSCGNFFDESQGRAYYAQIGGITTQAQSAISSPVKRANASSRLPSSPLDTERETQQKKRPKGRS